MKRRIEANNVGSAPKVQIEGIGPKVSEDSYDQISLKHPTTLGVQQIMPQQHVQIQQNNAINQSQQNIIIVPAGQQVIIVQETQETTKPVLIRQERIGCWCFSIHNQSCCCRYSCMQCFCECIQSNNLLCYCPNGDCVFYCLKGCITKMCQDDSCIGCLKQCCAYMPLCMMISCCKQQGCLPCIAKCCGYMPICLIIDCCKSQGCCKCICNFLCEMNACQCICGILRACTCTICDCIGAIFK